MHLPAELRMTRFTRGFTLIEVLVGSALITLITVGMLSVVYNYARNVARSNARQDLSELANLLTLNLANDQACFEALDGMPGFSGNPVSIIEVNDRQGNPIVTSNDRYGKLMIGQIRIENDPPGAVPPVFRDERVTFVTAAGGTEDYTFRTYRVNLVIPAAGMSGGTGGGGNELPPLMLPLRLSTVPGTGAFQRCVLSTANNQTCAALGGTFDHSEGICVFPVCDAAEATANNTQCPPPPPGGTCVPDPPLYFWGHRTLNNPQGLPETSIVCLCYNSCTDTPPPPPPSPY